MTSLVAKVLFCCFVVAILQLDAAPAIRSTKKPSRSKRPPGKSTKSVASTPSPSQCIAAECESRLLSNIQVHSYDLEYLCKNMDETTVQGQVTMNFTLKEPTTQLIYHGKRLLNLSEPELYEDGVRRAVSMRLYAPKDYVSLRSLTDQGFFTPNIYLLKQSFVVNLIDSNLGFYQGTFKEGHGKLE